MDQWLAVTPSWLGGSLGVGSRVGHTNQISNKPGVNVTDDGTGLCVRVANRLPIPRKDIWKVFDNYLEFQSLNKVHFNTRHHSGPVNQVGEVIAFEADPKYDSGTNYTVRLYEDMINDSSDGYDGSLLLTDMEFSFFDSIPKEQRSNILNYGIENANYHSKFIHDVAFDKIGLHFPVECTVNVPIDWFFSILSDWTNTDWVVLAKPVMFIYLFFVFWYLRNIADICNFFYDLFVQLFL